MVVGGQCGAYYLPGDAEFEALSPFGDLAERCRKDPDAFRREALDGLTQRCSAWAADPDAFFDAFVACWPENDRPRFVANRGRWMRILAANYGVEPDVDEDVALLSPWGFEPEDITTPVQAWHGADDRLGPVAVAEAFVARLPSGALTVYPGEGHYLAPEHHDEYLRFLTAW